MVRVIKDIGLVLTLIVVIAGIYFALTTGWAVLAFAALVPFVVLSWFVNAVVGIIHDRGYQKGYKEARELNK